MTDAQQPDALIERAWREGLDRRTILMAGADAASFLLASELESTRTLFWPVPAPLEAVHEWTKNPRSKSGEELRPWASAVIPACVVGGVIAWRLEAGDFGTIGIIIAAFVIIGMLFKLIIPAVLRRRVARLDEERALRVVLDQLRKGMRECPQLTPRAAEWIRRDLPVPQAGEGKNR